MIVTDQTRIAVIRLIGLLLLACGVAGALLGPVEMYVFYFFEEGGRFHYEGFRFGSLMFAYIAVQIAGYYVIAGLCIPLGYGHLRLRWWARPVMMVLIVDWLVVGLPLSLIALMMLVTSKGVTPLGLPFVAFVFILLYPVLPVLLLRFYRNPATERVFQAADISTRWLARTPQAVLVVASLMALLALALHLPLFFAGFFPLFGVTVSGLPGVLIADVLIAAAVILVVGLTRRRYWSWWGALGFLVLLTASSTITFLMVSPQEIVAQMPFALVEREALSGIPVGGFHLAVFFGLIPAVTLGIVAASHRHFRAASR